MQSGLTELTAYPFANSWKTSEVCADAEKSEQTPCEKNPLRRSFAETMCGYVLTLCLLFTYSHLVYYSRTHTVLTLGYYSFVSVCWLILLLNSKYSILLDIFIVSVLLLNVPILISKYHLQNQHQKRLLKLKARVSQEYLNCPN